MPPSELIQASRGSGTGVSSGSKCGGEQDESFDPVQADFPSQFYGPSRN